MRSKLTTVGAKIKVLCERLRVTTYRIMKKKRALDNYLISAINGNEQGASH
jgi:hypothetical protein